jgi:putative nucleotidyltransferase with HDIG domain
VAAQAAAKPASLSNWGTRWRVTALLAATLMFVALSFTTLALVRRTIAADGRTHALNATRASARQLDAWLQKKGDLLSQVGQVATTYARQDARLRNELRVLLLSDTDLLDVYFWRADGSSATGSGWQPPASFDVRTRPWFLASGDSRLRGITDPYVDLRTGRLIITLSRPILSPGGELIGVAGVDLKLLAAAHHLMLSLRQNAGRILVLDRQGRVMVDSRRRNPELREGSFRPVGQASPVNLRTALGEKDDGSLLGYPPGVAKGAPWLVSHSRVPSTGWTVVSFVPSSVLLAPFYLFLRGWLLVSAATVLAMLLLLLLFMERLLRPIERLLRLTRGNRVMYTEVAAGDELLHLTRSVNRLMAYLEAFPGVLNLMLGLKDGYTSHHTRQVAAYTVALGKALGLDERQLGELECAALLHDIGKAGVPDLILKKPAALSDEEWAAIRLHPVIGAEVAAEAGFAPAITQAIRQHHERLDGSGYPDRLGDQDIGLYARIIAVADTYHAMTSDRPYRPARDSSFAQAELVEGAGRRYDSRVVQAFLSALDSGPPDGGRRLETAIQETRQAEKEGIAAPSPA